MLKIIVDGYEYDVIEHKYKEYKGKYNLSGIEVDGMIYRFSRWLKNNEISYDDVDDVYNNTSCLRDGNRLDIHDSYLLKTDDRTYSIEFIWATENGVMFATLYDKEQDCWFGDIVIT